MSKSEKKRLATIAIVAFLLGSIPVWRCGVRENLTFWRFLKEHTIWGSPVEYVPEELLTGGWKQRQLQ